MSNLTLSIADIDRATNFLKERGFSLNGLTFIKGSVSVDVTSTGFDYRCGGVEITGMSAEKLMNVFNIKSTQ